MNLSHKRIAEIRTLVSASIQLGPNEAEDLLAHNDHLTELCEARARLVLGAESESKTLRGLYQMHQQTETREMRDLKAEVAGLRTGYEAYERVNAELKQKVANLEVCQTASLGMSGIIKCVAGELGFDAAGEDSAQDYLIGLARQANGLKAENEALRGLLDRAWYSDGNICTSNEWRDQYRAAMGKGEQS